MSEFLPASLRDDAGSDPSDQPKPDYIDGILSITFNECSIVAAEASQLALELVSARTLKGSYRVTDEAFDQTLHPLRYVDIGTIPLESDMTHNDRVKLILDENKGTDKKPHPRLLATFNNNIAVPIASFEKRTGGQCTYVQLGQEMDTDNLVVTSQDVRTDIVNGLRETLRGSRHQAIINFVNEQIAAQAACIETFLAPALCELAFEYYGELEPQKQHLFVLGQLGEEAQEIDVAGASMISDMMPQPAGRAVDYILAKTEGGKRKKQDHESPISLFTVTRENVAIHLLDFSASGKCTVMCEEDMRPATAEELVRLRQSIAFEKNSRHNLLRLQDQLERLQKDYNKRRYAQERLIEDELKGINHSQSRMAKAMPELFDVDTRLEAALGPYRYLEDSLIQHLGALVRSGRFYVGGTLPSRKIGNTTGDIEIVAKASAYWPQTYSVHIKGRPQALPDMEFATIFHETLSLTRPNILDTAKLAEVHATLGNIDPTIAVTNIK